MCPCSCNINLCSCFVHCAATTLPSHDWLIIFSGVVRPVKLNSDPHGDHGVKIVHSWQRVVEEQWVVGMVIRNGMKLSVYSSLLFIVV